MTMSDTFIVVSLLFGLGASLTAIGLLYHALARPWVDRSEQRLRAAPVTTLLLGILMGGGTLFIAVLLAKAPNPLAKFASILVFLAFFAVSFAGTAGLGRTIGSKLPSSSDRDRPWCAVVRGWIVLYLASLLPVLGWLVFLPAALLAGFGTAALSWHGPRHSPVEPKPLGMAERVA